MKVHVTTFALAAILTAVAARAPARADAPDISVLILGGGRDAAAANRALSDWQRISKTVGALVKPAAGYPRVVESKTIAGLHPGFFIVIAGFCTEGDAAKRLETLRAFVPGAYRRTVHGQTAACPTEAKDMRLGDHALLARKAFQLSVAVIEPVDPNEHKAKVVALLFEAHRLVDVHSRDIGPLKTVGEGWDGGCSVQLRKKAHDVTVEAASFTHPWTGDPREEWTDRYVLSVAGDAIHEAVHPGRRGQ